MHVLQEIMELFDAPEDSIEADEEPTQEAEVHLMATETVLRHPNTLTFQLSTVVQGQPVQFLVDSGSTHSFLNSNFQTSLEGVQI